jgi:hypothetical protein
MLLHVVDFNLHGKPEISEINERPWRTASGGQDKISRMMRWVFGSMIAGLLGANEISMGDAEQAVAPRSSQHPHSGHCSARTQALRERQIEQPEPRALSWNLALG